MGAVTAGFGCRAGPRGLGRGTWVPRRTQGAVTFGVARRGLAVLAAPEAVHRIRARVLAVVRAAGVDLLDGLLTGLRVPVGQRLAALVRFRWDKAPEAAIVRALVRRVGVAGL